MKYSLTFSTLALSLLAGAALAAGPTSPPTSGSKPTSGDGHSHSHSDAGKTDAHTGHGAQTTDADEFKSLDKNGDGSLSKDELSKHPFGPHFGMLDTDKNGRLSPAEFAAGKGM